MIKVDLKNQSDKYLRMEGVTINYYSIHHQIFYV
jgi:hypothetical protein